MIEFPEAQVIARQITQECRGKRIQSAVRGNVPHKFAFYTRPPEEYADILKDKSMGEAQGYGPQILVAVEPDYLLVLGGGGERIFFHLDESTLPKKHHLLLHFQDGTYLTVTVQGWGAAGLLHQSEFAAGHTLTGLPRVSPLSEAFTVDYFNQFFAQLPPEDPRSIKFFFISKPGVWGVGNGYLQDILWHARVHPRRRAIQVNSDEMRSLYQATRETLRNALELGGRDSERDLYNHPGGYARILDSSKVGQPCMTCGTPIEKISFLGGASYFCPKCQV